jgi:hypothetical protein
MPRQSLWIPISVNAAFLDAQENDETLLMPLKPGEPYFL